MIVYTTLKDGYVVGWGNTRSSDNDIEIELDDNHEFFNSDFSCWKYENNELIFDEEKRNRLIAEREVEENKPTETKLLREETQMVAMALMDLTEFILGGDV